VNVNALVPAPLSRANQRQSKYEHHAGRKFAPGVDEIFHYNG